MKEIIPPTPVPHHAPRPWVFLAGAIDRGRAAPWRVHAVSALADLPGTVLNPLRLAWDASWGQDLDDPRFAEQVDWELDGLEQVDVILCWLPADSQSPTTLLELGLHARRSRMVVGCPPGFHRRGNVRAVCRRFAIPHVDTLEDLMSTIIIRLTAGAGVRP